ncbi:MAG: transposase [Chromatiales bacterium]|nr:transposase [Chromatiales bacterium]
MGLDVRGPDSGAYRGKRKPTKKGDSELRRLLFNAAMQGRRTHYGNRTTGPCAAAG